MIKTLSLATTAAVLLVLATGPSHAADPKASHTGSHGTMNHGAMKAPENTTEADVVGVINSVDINAGSVNVTHEPVPSIGWPKMTMDIPVTNKVDLSTVKPGENVTFKLKQGRDKQFRIVEIAPAK